MLPPVLQKIQALREQALMRCSAIAENIANIIILSDNYTKLSNEGVGSGSTIGQLEAAVAGNCANIISLSDTVTKLSLNGGAGSSSVTTTLSPAGYTEALSGANVAPVSIVEEGTQAPTNAALVLSIENLQTV